MVCIIILNWNGIDVTVDCINSLLNIDYPNFKILIVDNGSKDNSLEVFDKEFSNNSIVEILALPKNLGFTGGNNKGIEYVKAKFDPDYYLLLNNDTVVKEDFLSLMVTSINKDTNSYAAVPKIFFFDKNDVLWFAGGSISKLTGIVKHFGLNQKDSPEFDIQKKVGFMNGCSALIKKEAIETLGMLDDNFFANSEDADYSIRITNSGHSIVYVPSSVVYHKVSHSFKSNKGKWFSFYLATRNIVLMQKKHLRAPMFALFVLVFFLRWNIYLTLKLLILRDYKSILYIYKGLEDGLKNRLRFVK